MEFGGRDALDESTENEFRIESFSEIFAVKREAAARKSPDDLWRW